MPSLFIVDDDPDVRFLVRKLAEESAGRWTVAGEAASGDEAIFRSRQMKPDVILLDVRMPGLSGSRRLHASWLMRRTNTSSCSPPSETARSRPPPPNCASGPASPRASSIGSCPACTPT
jgi:hypothetical protein